MRSSEEIQGQTPEEQAAWWMVTLEYGSESATYEAFDKWVKCPHNNRAFLAAIHTMRRVKDVDLTRLVGRAQRAELESKSLSESRERHVVRPVPGTRLAEIARLLLTRQSYQRYVAPLIADMQQEYVDAVAARRSGEARWIAIRGHLLVVPNWLWAFAARAIRRIFTA